jgi:hypothetical protein
MTTEELIRRCEMAVGTHIDKCKNFFQGIGGLLPSLLAPRRETIKTSH